MGIPGDDGATPIHFAARFRAVALSRGRATSRQVSTIDGGNNEDVKSEEDVHRAVAAALLNAEVITGEVSLSGTEVMMEDESIINYLMENSADVNCGDKYGLTPLHYACNKSNVVATRELLKWPGIEVDVRKSIYKMWIHYNLTSVKLIKSQINSSFKLAKLLKVKT